MDTIPPILANAATPTDEDLDAILARWEAAPAGPYELHETEAHVYITAPVPTMRTVVQVPAGAEAAMAAAAEDVPRLLKRIYEQGQELARLRRADGALRVLADGLTKTIASSVNDGSLAHVTDSDSLLRWARSILEGNPGVALATNEVDVATQRIANIVRSGKMITIVAVTRPDADTPPTNSP